MYVTTNEDLATAVEDLSTCREIGLDTETTSLNPYDGRLRLMQLSTPKDNYVVDFDKVKPSDSLRALLADQAAIKVAHNAKFEAKWIKNTLGVELHGIFDSFLASQIIGAGRPDHRHGLEAVALRYLDKEMDKTHQKSDWSGDLSQSQIDYAENDTAVLLPLRTEMVQVLKKRGLISCAVLEFNCIPSVAAMELKGIFLDRERWMEQVDRATIQKETLSNELQEMLSVGAKQQTLFFRQDINLDSHVQLREALTALGVPVPDSTINWKLKPLAREYPSVEKLLEYRVVAKQLTSFGENILAYIHPKTGRVHADFWQIGAATGRFSSREPNIQQVPHSVGYRRCFRPSGEKLFVIADYSQIELRILADFSGDRDFIAAFRSGDDLHSITASKVFNVPLDRVTPERRSFAKNLNFGVVYGIGAPRFAMVTGITVDEAAQMIKNYFKQYPDLGEWLTQAGADAVETGYSRTASGRLVEYTFDRFDKKSLSATQRNGKNTPIQGTGADILKRAMHLLHNRLDPEHAAIVNVVHDEIVVEVDKDNAEDVRIQVESAMKEAGEEFITAVPIEVSTAVTDQWVK